eukprot:m.508005 g.508005  ORF g.508005 m.508005 type:complete len:60 (+) comp87986_c0_seq1:131-310(+)
MFCVFGHIVFVCQLCLCVLVSGCALCVCLWWGLDVASMTVQQGCTPYVVEQRNEQQNFV